MGGILLSKSRKVNSKVFVLISIVAIFLSVGGYYAFEEKGKPLPKSNLSTLSTEKQVYAQPSIEKGQDTKEEVQPQNKEQETKTSKNTVSKSNVSTDSKPNVNTASKSNANAVSKSNVNTDTSGLSNKKLSWYFMPNKNHTLPGFDAVGSKLVNKYNGIYHGDSGSKTLYLTFDEGYEAGYTPKVLDSLKVEGVKATFFITGHYIDSKPDLVKRMVNEGHIVGNHTMTHPSLPSVSDQQFKNELDGVNEKLENLTGMTMNFIRPPEGAYSERTLKLAKDMGYRQVFWSVAFKDWVPTWGTPDGNMQTVLGLIHPGAVILLHPENKANADMLISFIKACRNEGYTFGTLNQL